MSKSTLKEQFINVIDFNYERELWHSRPEQAYMESIEPFLSDLIQVAECHKQNKTFELHKCENDTEDDTNIDATIGKRIRKLRQQKGLTLTQLAKNSNLDIGYLKSVERGMSILRMWALGQIAYSLNVKSSEILPF